MKPAIAMAALIAFAPIAAQAFQPAPKVDHDSLVDHLPQRPSTVVDVSGAWQINGSIEAGATIATVAPACDFKQAGGKLTGACKGPNGQGPVTGTVVGRTVSWQWEVTATTAVGASGTASFRGSVGDAGALHGTWTFSRIPGLSGEFTAKRR